MTLARFKSHREAVAFRSQHDVPYIEAPPLEPNRRPPKGRLRMAKRVYEIYDGSHVTDSMLQEASQLFSENYGVWGKKAASGVGAFAKEGKLVQIIDPIPSANKNRKPCEDRYGPPSNAVPSQGRRMLLRQSYCR